MWWDKDGLTSGGVECAPVRVFLVPSFCVFMCRLLLPSGVVEQWGFASHLVFGGGVAVAGNDFLPWRYSAEGTHVTNAHGCWKSWGCGGKGVYLPPLVWTARGARVVCPARRLGVRALCWVTLGGPSRLLFFAVTCFVWVVIAVARNYACLTCVGFGRKPLRVSLLRLRSCPRDP